MSGDKRLRIGGHVEAEALWKLKYCLIGEMPSVRSLEKVQNRLHEWGMGDIKVRRLGGITFILTIEDMDFYKMLEDLQWSYLKEVFSEVRPWTESESKIHRATWIEILGVPIHCWNGTTFRRETVTVKSVQKKGSLVSPSLSESFRSEGSTKEVTQQARAGEEAFSEVNIGKQSNHGFVGAVMGKGSSISDRELMGEEPEIVADDTVKSKNRNKMLEGDMKNEKKNVNWAELLFKDELARVETGVRLGSSRNIVREASFSNQVLGGPNGAKEGFVDKLGTNPSQRVNLEASTAPLSGQREKQVCGVENNSPSPIDKSLDIELEVVEDRSSDSEKEEGLYKAERIFFPEIDSKRESGYRKMFCFAWLMFMAPARLRSKLNSGKR
ncbi:hypothetical protein V6N13_020023 [Hibiscus sabdariffa]